VNLHTASGRVKHAMSEQDRRLGSMWVDIGGLRIHARAATDAAFESTACTEDCQ